MRWASAVLAGAALASGCFNTPTPLAPGLHGTVGVPNRGVLTESEELPLRGPGFVRFRPQSSHYFGRPRLVRALENAAASVARLAPGGAPLSIGDLSAKTGGRIPGHDSHRSGRDVDLLFMVTTPAGASVRSPGFVRFEGDGLARVDGSSDYVRIDIDRQWLLLRSLLTSPEIGVQFMFVCREIEALLIDHARALGEPDLLVWQAETVMLEPSDSLRHDDHIHLRIACSAEEAVAGCSGGGPRWQWLPPYEPVRPLQAADWDEIAKEDPFDLAEQLAGEAKKEARGF
ncbi:MAG TPA: penicillin-insensitive murein endopeptidase [Polyangiaceae bacterium]|nr:penicillin-insensitive murein endopeptidase [Polyangiaceae bacterium]